MILDLVERIVDTVSVLSLFPVKSAYQAYFSVSVFWLWYPFSHWSPRVLLQQLQNRNGAAFHGMPIGIFGA